MCGFRVHERSHGSPASVHITTGSSECRSRRVPDIPGYLESGTVGPSTRVGHCPNETRLRRSARCRGTRRCCARKTWLRNRASLKPDKDRSAVCRSRWRAHRHCRQSGGRGTRRSPARQFPPSVRDLQQRRRSTPPCLRTNFCFARDEIAT